MDKASLCVASVIELDFRCNQAHLPAIETIEVLERGANMVSAISRILSFDRFLSGLLFLVPRRLRRRTVLDVEDLPDDLVADVGLENIQRPFDSRADIWRRQGGLGDHLRPGPM